MKTEIEYNNCSAQILSEYQQIKGLISDNNIAVCQHVGTFSQDILISIVSLVERTLLHKGEPVRLQKRLIYLSIECIQNIIFHSDNLPKSSHLAYFFITRTTNGYIINSANTVKNTNLNSLENKLHSFLNVKTDILTKLFKNKIQNPIIDKEGSGGLGLLTIISKSGNGFKYEVTEVSKNYSIFHIELKINYKNFR